MDASGRAYARCTRTACPLYLRRVTRLALAGRDAAARKSATPGGDAAAAEATSKAATPGPGSVPDIERVFREEYGRAVAVLVRVFGDIDVAEEAVQDAFTAAVQRWPSSGLPPSPAGWIITTARNRAIEIESAVSASR